MALESLESTYKEFIRFKNEILSHNNLYNIRTDICEDLFQDTVIVFLSKYDENRGSARAFFITVFRNKMKDFVKKDRFSKIISIMTIQDEGEEIPDTEETEILVPEGFDSIHHFVASLKKVLSDEEKEFLGKLSDLITDVSSHGLISEVARELDIAPNEGWNIWKRIIRKAKKHASERKEARDKAKLRDELCLRQVLREKADNLMFQLRKEMESGDYHILQESIKFDQLNFLSPGNIRRLLEIFSKEFFPDPPKSP